MFKQIFEHLQGSGTALNLTIAVVDDKLIVSVKIQPVKKGEKESPFDNLSPVTMTGTAEEFDNEFIEALKAPITRAKEGMQVNVEKFDESLKDAAEEESKSTKKSSSKSTSKTALARKKPAPAFMKKMQADKALAAIIGSEPMPRTEAVKKLWEYVKKNELQGKKDKRKITLDDKMQKVFGDKKTISMFDMTKKMAEHLKEVKEDPKPAADTKKEEKTPPPAEIKISDGQMAIDAAKALAEKAKGPDGANMYKQAWEQLQDDLKKKKFTKAEVTVAEQLIFDWKKAKMMAEADLDDTPQAPEPAPVTESDDITIPASEKKKPVPVEKVPVITEDVMPDTPLAEELDENLSDIDETVEPETEEEVDDDF